MKTPIVKSDEGKPQLNLVPLELLEPLARVREFAVEKYGLEGIESWRNISDDRLLAALLRHTITYQKDHDARDEESGLPAAYHVAINGAFLAIKAMERMKERCGSVPLTWHRPSATLIPMIPFPAIVRRRVSSFTISLRRADGRR